MFICLIRVLDGHPIGNTWRIPIMDSNEWNNPKHLPDFSKRYDWREGILKSLGLEPGYQFYYWSRLPDHYQAKLKGIQVY